MNETAPTRFEAFESYSLAYFAFTVLPVAPILLKALLYVNHLLMVSVAEAVGETVTSVPPTLSLFQPELYLAYAVLVLGMYVYFAYSFWTGDSDE